MGAGPPSLLCCSAACGDGEKRGNNAACLLCSCPPFQWTLVWNWQFLPPWQSGSPQSALSLSFLFSEPHPRGPPPCLRFSLSAALPVWLFWLTVSLIPWLSEFHAVWFSSTSGCLLILDWLLSIFWLCKEMKDFYLRLHLGQNCLLGFFKGSKEWARQGKQEKQV